MKSKNNRIHLLTLLVVTLFLALPLKAQVAVGDNVDPHIFSILELITKNKDGGLRLPQLSTKERDDVAKQWTALDPESDIAKAAQGLIIYNTTTDCLEFWNGRVWISMCGNASNRPTVASETNPTLTENGNIRLTAYVNAMYDFQFQKLTAWLASGAATAYQWQMSKDGATWYDIVDAKNANYVVPADFMYKLGDLGLDKDNTDASSPGNNSLEIQFRCQVTNGVVTDNTTSENILSMLFIRTNTQGYGIDPATGVRYLTIQKGKDGDNNGATTTGTIKIALLNLGQSGTGSYINGVPQNMENGELNDAGDLGDFYQWGRIADGHEHIVWSKNSSYENQILPYDDGKNFTSNTAPKNSSLQQYTTILDDGTYGQIKEGTYGYGKFILLSNSDWGQGGSTCSDRWGDGTTARPAAEITWTYPSNDPCPSGWRVPSVWNLWDIYRGDGAIGNNPVAGSYGSGAGFVNSWRWRDTANNAVGGVIVTNVNSEIVFLPAIGARSGVNGPYVLLGVNCLFWSSTISPTGSSAQTLSFSNTTVYPSSAPSGNYYSNTSGHIIRCVAE